MRKFARPDLPSPDPHKREMDTYFVVGAYIDEKFVKKIRELTGTDQAFRKIAVVFSFFENVRAAKRFCTMVRDAACIDVAIEHMSIPASAVPCLADALKRMDIQVLKICDVELFDAGAEALAAAFRECPSLRTIMLRKNEITPSGGALVASALRSGAVELLDLSGNKLGASFATRVVYTGCKLTRLMLNATDLGQSGFETLCSELLRHDVHLLTLGVAENAIGDVGCAAGLLAHPRSMLRNLDLSSNNISNITVLREAISLNRSITDIWLENNRSLGDADIVSAFLYPRCPVTNLMLGIVSLSGTRVSLHVNAMLDARLARACNWRARVMIALCTVKVPRLAARGAAINKLPTDIIRLVADLLRMRTSSLQ